MKALLPQDREFFLENKQQLLTQYLPSSLFEPLRSHLIPYFNSAASLHNNCPACSRTLLSMAQRLIKYYNL